MILWKYFYNFSDLPACQLFVKPYSPADFRLFRADFRGERNAGAFWIDN